MTNKTLIEKKIWPEFFEAIASGLKTYEFRLGDFPCEVGDRILLKEWNPETKSYTGRQIEKGVGHLSRVRVDDYRHWTKDQVTDYGYYVISLVDKASIRYNWESLWKKIRDTEGLQEWTVVPTDTTDGLCQRGAKRILLGTKMNTLDICRLLLHEVAHALTPDSPAPGHTIEWWNVYCRLLVQYLDCTPPTQSDLIAFGVHQGWHRKEEKL